MKFVLVLTTFFTALSLMSCSSTYFSKEGDIQLKYEKSFSESCSSCQDPVYLNFENKMKFDQNSLSLEEKQLYATLKQNCEICMASHRVAYQINSKPNQTIPMWITIVLAISTAVAINSR